MNICSFIGRLTKDPELKRTQSGVSYTRFCLAVDGIKDKNGNKTTDFIDCVAWNKSAEIISKYSSKGSKLGVVGRLHTTTAEANGEKRKYTDIIVDAFDLLDSKPKTQCETAPAAETAPAVTAEDTQTFDPSLPFNI